MITAGVKLIALIVALSASNMIAQEDGDRARRGDGPPPRQQAERERSNQGSEREVENRVRERVRVREEAEQGPRNRVAPPERQNRQRPSQAELSRDSERQGPALRRGAPGGRPPYGGINRNGRADRDPGVGPGESRRGFGPVGGRPGFGRRFAPVQNSRFAPMQRSNPIEEAYQKGFRDGFREANSGPSRGPVGRGFGGPRVGPGFRNQLGGFGGGQGRAMGPIGQARFGGGGRGPAQNDDGSVSRGADGAARGPGSQDPRFQDNQPGEPRGPGEGNNPAPGMDNERRGPGGPGGINRGRGMGPGPFGPGMGGPGPGPGRQGNGPGPKFGRNQENNGEGFRDGGQPQLNDRGTNAPGNQGRFGRPEPQGNQRGPGARRPQPDDDRDEHENRSERSESSEQ